MNPTAQEIMSYYGISNELDNNSLEHYGIPRRSGRYPWGSGEDPYQHENRDFLGRVDEMRKAGFTYTDEKGKKWTGDTAIAKSMGLSTTQFRTEIAIANDERRTLNVETAKRLRDKEGLNPTEIGRKMGVNESTVRSWFNEEAEVRTRKAKETANFLKEQVDGKRMVDVGADVERELNISRQKLDQAIYMLEREGYHIYQGRMPQPTNPGKFTTTKVLAAPDVEHKEIFDWGNVKTVNDYISRDNGETYEKKFHYPESLDSKRLMIRYAEDGGIQKDGLVELRRGVDDLSLGDSHYSQVRIMVDGTHYIKGMAAYSDDSNFPKGVDVIFNTNKSKSVAKMDVLKKIKDDLDNPFGSLIKDSEQGGQYWYTDKKTGEKKLGLINKRADEGDWNEWADKVPSQFLSKQSKTMAKKQLNLLRADKAKEYDEICELTNPTVKKYLLKKFADECDAAAVDLKAAPFPGQKYHVIMPVPTLKDTEVYAPQYENGSKLALVRYPHGGLFEIPILTVNNKHADSKKLIGTDSGDAICINSKVAERLSGADFDGDTVMCIPTHNGNVKIANRDPLKDLIGFDPKTQYGPESYKGRTIKLMKDPVTGADSTQTEMGKISNLITDMTLAGASSDKIARAVKHSMVVIDAAKHSLDYKRSYMENDIESLIREYQPKGNGKYGGAATLISRAKGEATVLKRQGEGHINLKGKEWYDPSRPEGAIIYKNADDLYYPVRSINKKTGMVTIKVDDGSKITYDPKNKADADRYTPVKRVNKDTGEVTYTDKTGAINYKLKARTQPSTNMAETDNAYSLVSPMRHPMELIYADHANLLKGMANQARKEMMSTGKIEYSSSAKKTYQKEYDSLMYKLNEAKKNSVRERAAARLANAEVAAKIKADPTMKNADKKKANQQAMSKYREEVGSVSRRKRNIEIAPKEWEAIQAGAISESRLKQILDNTDIDKIRELATPRTTLQLSPSKISTIKAMSASNYTLEQIASKLGVSPSTVSKYLKAA